MRGVLLCGGLGSRLSDLTLNSFNKHILPVFANGNYAPMMVHGIKKFVEAGITEIIVIIGPEHPDSIIKILGDGSKFKCNLTFRIQSQPGGIAQALGLCETFVGQDTCCVILGDNIFEDSLQPYIEKFNLIYEINKSFILLKEVKNPERFGVATINKKLNKIVGIREKPGKLEYLNSDYSKLAVTGIYFYSNKVFNVIKWCKPSQRGELEITDVNNYFSQDEQIHFDIFQGFWSDVGTVDSYMKTNKYFMNKNLNA